MAHIFIYVDSSERSKDIVFKRNVSIDNKGQARITIPKHIVEEENIKNKDRVRFKIESIRGQ